ncbi:MAG: hypothetical protein KY455_01660 [Euryarchaeota archaeon]|nr:hypothetical protein [Euryarchaeota archaeon]
MDIPIFVTIVLLVAGHAPFDTQDGTTHQVIVRDFEYHDGTTGTPITLARVGDVVAFVHGGGFHTATGGVGSLALGGDGPDSPILDDEGDVYEFRVTAAGTYTYTCLIHAEMNGIIVAGR